MNSNPSSNAPPPIRLSRIVGIAVVLVIIGLAIGFVPRWHARHAPWRKNRPRVTFRP